MSVLIYVCKCLPVRRGDERGEVARVLAQVRATCWRAARPR